VLLKLKDGVWIRPHVHPNLKRVQVISGILLLGTAATFDTLGAQRLSPGSLATVPANTPHFEGARGETVLSLSGEGPMTTRFVSQLLLPAEATQTRFASAPTQPAPSGGSRVTFAFVLSTLRPDGCRRQVNACGRHHFTMGK
jgi:hypothetical protein